MRPGTRPTGPADRRGTAAAGGGRDRAQVRRRGRAAPAAARRPGRAPRGAAARRGARSPRRGSAAGPQFGPETAIKLPRTFGARGRRSMDSPRDAGPVDSAGRPVEITVPWFGRRSGAAPPNGRRLARNWRYCAGIVRGQGRSRTMLGGDPPFLCRDLFGSYGVLWVRVSRHAGLRIRRSQVRSLPGVPPKTVASTAVCQARPSATYRGRCC